MSEEVGDEIHAGRIVGKRWDDREREGGGIKKPRG